MKKTRIWGIRIGLLLTSIVVSLLALEIVIRTFLYYNLGPTKFERFSPGKDLLLEQHNKGFNHDSFYEQLFSKNKSVELVTLGDSYTNGGNVAHVFTYPYLLYRKFNSKFEIVNMGVCEDTTNGAYLRLKDYIQKYRTKKSRDLSVIIILIGAADYFNFWFEGQYKHWNVRTHDTLFINPLKDFDWDYRKMLYRFKSYKMYRYVYRYFYSKYAKVTDVRWSLKVPEFTIYKKGCLKCFENYNHNLKENKLCIKKASEIFIRGYLKKGYKLEKVKELLYRSFAYNIETYFWDNKLSINYTKNTLLFMEIYPESLLEDTFTREVTYHFQNQSSVTPDEFLNVVKNTLKQTYNLKLSKKLNVVAGELKRWIENQNKIGELALEAWDKIFKLVRDNDILPILMTYPVVYKKSNQNIRQAARKYKARLIDLEKYFLPKLINKDEYRKYIVDKDHATELGYKAMSDLVYKEILDVMKKRNGAHD